MIYFMQIIMEEIMQLMKISLVSYMMKNYVKNRHTRRDNILDVFEQREKHEKLQNLVLRCLESSRMIFNIFTLC